MRKKSLEEDAVSTKMEQAGMSDRRKKERASRERSDVMGSAKCLEEKAASSLGIRWYGRNGGLAT